MENKGNELFALLKKLNPVYITNMCNTLLKSASEQGHAEVVKMLLESFGGYVFDGYIEAAYFNAFRRQDTEIMSLLGPRLSALKYDHHLDFSNILGGFCEVTQVDKDIKFFRYCAENKYVPVDLSMDNNSAIRMAATNGNPTLVRFLMSYPNVDPSDFDNEALRDCLYELTTNATNEFSKIKDQKDRVRYIETVRVLLSDTRVDQSYLLSHVFKSTKPYISEIETMFTNALRRRNILFIYKVDSLPRIIPRDLRVIIMARSLSFQKGRNYDCMDMLALAFQLRIWNTGFFSSFSQEVMINGVTKFLDSF